MQAACEFLRQRCIYAPVPLHAAQACKRGCDNSHTEMRFPSWRRPCVTCVKGRFIDDVQLIWRKSRVQSGSYTVNCAHRKFPLSPLDT